MKSIKLIERVPYVEVLLDSDLYYRLREILNKQNCGRVIRLYQFESIYRIYKTIPDREVIDLMREILDLAVKNSAEEIFIDLILDCEMEKRVKIEN